MSVRETSHEIDAQAADWASRVDRAPLSPEEQAELDAWLAADARRLGAYAKARAMFVHVRRVRALGPDFDPEAFANDGGDGEGDDDREFDRRSASVRPSRRKLMFLAGAAAVAVGSVAAVAGLGGLGGWRSRIRTQRGEVRLFSLADGSTVTLNTDSLMEVRFDAARRLVRLIAGEALFDVVKDLARPFVVEAGDMMVRAIGTSFTVRRLADHPVEVLVRQGIVEVARNAGVAAVPLRVAANMRATAAGPLAVEAAPVPAPQVARELAWREGMLSFEDVRLDQAAAQFARYSDTRIVIDDPAVASQTVTGLFSASNPAGFAQAAAATLDLHAEVADDEVRLRR